MLADSITYAARSLAKRRLRSWLTIIGIFIGIASVVALISLGQGMREAIIGQFAGLGADRINVQARGGGFGPPGLGSAAKITEKDLEVVQKSAHVDLAAGRIIRPTQVTYDGAVATAFTASLPRDKEQRELLLSAFNYDIREGRMLSADDTGKVVLGASIEDSNKWDEPIPIGKKIRIENDSYEVIGVLVKTGGIPTDGGILINEKDARKTLNLPDEYSVITARADNPENILYAKQAILKDLRKSRNVEERKEDFDVETSDEVIKTFDTVLNVVTGVLAGIAAISLLVGGIGIMNTMYTAVIERTKEIGIMKAIGARNGQILQIFLLESGMLGLVGATIGVLVGIGLSKTVQFGAAQAFGPNFLQANTPMWLIISSLAFGFIVGTLSGFFPARRAAQLPPVEALR